MVTVYWLLGALLAALAAAAAYALWCLWMVATLTRRQWQDRGE